MYLSLSLLPKEVSILKVTIFSKHTHTHIYITTFCDLIIDDEVDEPIIYVLCPSMSANVLQTVFSLSVCTKVECTHALFMCSAPF